MVEMANEFISISVFDTIGSLCVASDDGQKVFNVIKKVFDDGLKVKLSFRNTCMITGAFLNSAISQLNACFDGRRLEDNLRIEDISDEDRLYCKGVMSIANLYYENPEKMENAISEILEDEE
ncbi:MAG: STAS-like domain-containing protein [Chlorobi bacterium]|nr:STAS-like domain-containing protein [Chlorobiota bacterium]